MTKRHDLRTTCSHSYIIEFLSRYVDEKSLVVVENALDPRAIYRSLTDTYYATFQTGVLNPQTEIIERKTYILSTKTPLKKGSWRRNSLPMFPMNEGRGAGSDCGK